MWGPNVSYEVVGFVDTLISNFQPTFIILLCEV